jgi:TonB family protein
MKWGYYFAVSAAAHAAVLNLPLVTSESGTEVLIPVRIIVDERRPLREKLNLNARVQNSAKTLERSPKLSVTKMFSSKILAQREPSLSLAVVPEPAAAKPVAPLQPPEIAYGEETARPNVNELPGDEPSDSRIESGTGSENIIPRPATVGSEPELTPVRYAPAGYAHNPAPEYPEQARREGWEGTVLLGVLINRQGSPEKVEVKRGSGFEILDRAATQAVMGWRFHPARHGETTSESWVSVPIVFRLSTSENWERQRIVDK